MWLCTSGLSLVVQARGLYVVMHECIISGSASPRAVCGYCTSGLSLVVQARGCMWLCTSALSLVGGLTGL